MTNHTDKMDGRRDSGGLDREIGVLVMVLLVVVIKKLSKK